MNFKKLAVAAAALSFAFSAFAAGIPAQKLDKSLHAKLPASIQKSGVLRDAVNGSFPPYYVVTPDKKIQGARSPTSRRRLARFSGSGLSIRIFLRFPAR